MKLCIITNITTHLDIKIENHLQGEKPTEKNEQPKEENDVANKSVHTMNGEERVVVSRYTGSKNEIHDYEETKNIQRFVN